MNTESSDPTVPDGEHQEIDQEGKQPSECCCVCARKTPLIVLLLIVLAGIVGSRLVVQQIGGNLRATEAYREAMEKIQGDPALREELGEPITASWRTAGRSEEHEADLLFTIHGPKGEAKVHAHGKTIQGTWGLDTLDVTLKPSGKVLKPLQGDEGGAPLFEATKPADDAKPQDNTLAPEINLPAPSAIPE